ncbi:YceI family protein [Ammonicoccus fulvus]|uniref:YceI family protein n=1 Tax=Ammonicoccus fulvus TaxID=3138240 RepID=A0ABZ3FNF2_9ACTN
MKIQPGVRELGPTDAELVLYTTCEGPAAALGHDLTIVAERWSATLTIGGTPAECALEANVDLTSLDVRESFGGAKEVSDSDRAEIEHNMAESLQIAQHPELRFVATEIRGTWRNGGEVDGDLTLAGQTQPVTLNVVERDGVFRLGGEIRQSAFGIKPYSAMMGALRIVDSVVVGVSVPVS